MVSLASITNWYHWSVLLVGFTNGYYFDWYHWESITNWCHSLVSLIDITNWHHWEVSLIGIIDWSVIGFINLYHCVISLIVITNWYHRLVSLVMCVLTDVTRHVTRSFKLFFFILIIIYIKYFVLYGSLKYLEILKVRGMRDIWWVF